MTADAHHGAHQHGHVHLDEAAWAAMVDQTELQGEVLMRFVTDTARWVAELRGPDAPPVRRVIDIGSGPGVGTCELARLFPEATVIAVDSSPAMLEQTIQRSAAQGLDARISTHIAELPDGLDELRPADVVWASMALHHVGDEIAALCRLGELLDPDGLIAIAELADPMRVLPDDLDLGRPGLGDRLESAGATWFAQMREGLPESVPSTDLASMVTSAGFEVVGSRLAREHHGAPLSDDARRVVLGHLERARTDLADQLDDDDLNTLDVLSDVDDPRSVMHRSDVFIESSRQIVVARPMGGR